MCLAKRCYVLIMPNRNKKTNKNDLEHLIEATDMHSATMITDTWENKPLNLKTLYSYNFCKEGRETYRRK